MPARCRTQRFSSTGVVLVGDRWDPDPALPRRGIVVLLHGGGQTRHSWRETGTRLADRGWAALALDARGHGDSAWAPDQNYTYEAMVADLRSIVDTLDEKPVLVGASMGGLVSLVAQAEDPDLGRGLVLVDVTPRLEAEGVREITEFMRRGTEGFATLEDAAEAIRAHTPQRRRAPRMDGLKKNLRKVGDRWHWHWDPHFLSHVGGEQGVPGTDTFADWAHSLASTIQVPTLLARGLESRVVGEESVHELMAALPSAQFVDVAGTGHMVAGDDNDAFSAALLQFLAQFDELSQHPEGAAAIHD